MPRRIDEKRLEQAIELYRQGLSERQVARELGVHPSTVHQILVRHNEPRRSKTEGRMRYPKTDFCGDLMEKARIIGFIEDCSAGYRSKQIRVQTGTTHPAELKLFNNFFAQYGHIGKISGYNKRYSLYQWQTWVLLNPTFDFIVEYKMNPMNFLSVGINRNNTKHIYISSLIDAEGSIGICVNNGYAVPVLSISNTNRELLQLAQQTIGGDIFDGNGCYELRLYREDAIQALRVLPIMHGEKAAAKELILHHADNGAIGMDELRTYRELRRRIDEEVRLCTLQARLEYIRRHGKPHRYDPDQTIPRNYSSPFSPSYCSHRFSQHTLNAK